MTKSISVVHVPGPIESGNFTFMPPKCSQELPSVTTDGKNWSRCWCPRDAKWKVGQGNLHYCDEHLPEEYRKKKRKLSFFFHYNKPASQRDGRPRISVHIQNRCHIVDNIVCGVPTEGRLHNRQPRFVMAGKCMSWEILEGVMYLR